MKRKVLKGLMWVTTLGFIAFALAYVNNVLI